MRTEAWAMCTQSKNNKQNMSTSHPRAWKRQQSTWCQSLRAEDTKYLMLLDPVIVLAWGFWLWSCLESHTEQTKKKILNEIWHWCYQFDSKCTVTLCWHLKHVAWGHVFLLVYVFFFLFSTQTQQTFLFWALLKVFFSPQTFKVRTCKKMPSDPPST